MDAKLRQYLLGVVVSILISAGGCAATKLYARVDKVEEKVNDVEKTHAVTDTEIKEFRKSFEEFKTDVKKDIDRHHR